LPDVILVGSTTAVAEHYTPPSSSVSTKARRLSNGAWPVARVAVISSKLNFDLALPLFNRPDQRPIVVTTEDADPEQLHRVAKHADVLQCGTGSVDFSKALTQMATLGAKVVLSEGGPSVNGALSAEGLVDEILISVSPLVGGGASGGIIRGAILKQPQEFVLRHVLTEDHFLFLRYVRQVEDP
jgi:5-amino-6-(5-phosphoribosylamino)uracil reductase